VTTVSIVLPVFNEEGTIDALYQRLLAVVPTLGSDVEFIFVDDGSEDGSAAKVEALRAKDDRVKLLRLSRNFGHQVALTAGLDHAEGDAVISMDSDLQHPPELLTTLVEKWRQGFEVVYTIRTSAKSPGVFKRATSSLYYRLFRRLTGVDLPANAADFRLMDKKVVRSLRRMRERHRFLRGLVTWVGYRAVGVDYVAGTRFSGPAKYTLSKMLHVGVDGIVSFSTAPLHAAIYLGFAMSLFGFLYAVYSLYARFISGRAVPGWTSLIGVSSIIGGIQLFLLGVIGLYIGRMYDEVKGRPLYIVQTARGLTPIDERDARS
jgi:polyisoprenyl-phosphate glycosyltransferase